MACNHAVWPLEFRRKEVATKEKMRITSDFHTGYKWGPGHLLFSAVVSGLWLGTHYLACRKSWACFIQPLGVYWTIAILSIQVLGQTEDWDYYAAAIAVASLSDHTLSQSLLNFPVCRVSGVHGTATLLFGDAVPLSPVCPSPPAPRTLDSMPCPLSMWLFPVELGYFSYWADLNSVTSIDKHLKMQITSVLKIKKKKPQNKSIFTPSYYSVFYPSVLLQANLFQLFFLNSHLFSTPCSLSSASFLLWK